MTKLRRFKAMKKPKRNNNKIPNWNELLVLKYCASVNETYANEVSRNLKLIPLGTVATQLGILWDKGFLQSYCEQGSTADLGRPLRRFYGITIHGHRYLNQLEQELAYALNVYGNISVSQAQSSCL